MARIGDMAMLPNGAGLLARVVGVHPLYRASDKDQVAAIQYETQVKSGQTPVGMKPVGVPVARDGSVAQSTLLGAQQSADDAAVSNIAATSAANTTSAVQRTSDPVREPQDMSTQERAELQQIQARDAAVRQEEETHAATAGPYAGAPQYEYQQGPDGRMYVVNGEVPIRFSSAATASPEQAEQALRAIRASAQSPQAPSSADMQVFQQASQLSQEAARKYGQAEGLRADKAQNAWGVAV